MDAVISGFGNPMEQDNTRLAARLRERDPDVLDELIERFQHRLFRYLLSLTGDKSKAEDLFQETWLRVLERGHQYRPRWRFEVWLFSIARNLVIDMSRLKKGASLDQMMDTESGLGFDPAARQPSPLDETLAEEETKRMTQFLQQIPAAFREVLTLRFQEELPLEDVASVIGAPLSTVKSRLYRALEKLREVIEEKVV